MEEGQVPYGLCVWIFYAQLRRLIILQAGKGSVAIAALTALTIRRTL